MKMRPDLSWQSRLVLLLTIPAIGASLVLEVHWWAVNMVQVMAWVMELSALMGLIAAISGVATPWAAVAGAAIASSIGLSTAVYPYIPWRTGLAPLALMLLMTSLATRAGRIHKIKNGCRELVHGRNAAQAAANLGVAALVFSEPVQALWMEAHWVPMNGAVLGFAVGLAALAETAGDTVSSEIGQAMGGTTRLLTTMRRVEPGTDGGLSLAGTFAGMAAAAVIALTGVSLLGGGVKGFCIALGGAVAGFFCDSLLGASFERRGWINNDLVNFLSTLCAAVVALIILLFCTR